MTRSIALLLVVGLLAAACADAPDQVPESDSQPRSETESADEVQASVYAGGPVSGSKTGDGEEQVLTRAAQNGMAGAITAFVVTLEGEGVITAVQVLGADMAESVNFAVDDNADGALQASESDTASDHGGDAARKTSVRVMAKGGAANGVPVGDRGKFRLLITIDSPSSVDYRWEAVSGE